MSKLRFGVLCRGMSFLAGNTAGAPAKVIRPIEEREPDASGVIDYLARTLRS